MSRRGAAAQPHNQDDEGAPNIGATLVAINATLNMMQNAIQGMNAAVEANAEIGQAAQAAAQAATQIGQAVAQAVQAATAALPALAPAEAPDQEFLRTPLAKHSDGVIRFDSKAGSKYYEQATQSLFSTNERFDVEPNRFQMFINLLHNRAKDLGMLKAGANAMVPVDVDNPAGEAIDSIAAYGSTTLAQVTAWETTFINTESRNSQNTKILYELIKNSLSVQGFQRVQVWKDQYTIGEHMSGGCFLKIVIRESHLDTNATISTLRLNLCNLDAYVRDNGTDIAAFNTYVQNQIDGLSARGETTDDLIVNLFKGYKEIKDENFSQYIRQIENGHEDGTSVIDPHSLMIRAVNFYKKQLLRKEWDQPSKHKLDVMALEAKIASLQKMQKQGGGSNKNQPKGKDVGDKSKSKASSSKPERPKWLSDHVKPKEESIKEPRKWNNAKWYWCGDETGGKCGGKWRTHKPSECKGLGKPASEKKGDRVSNRKRKADALKLATANEALMDAKEDDSDYST